MSHAASCKSCCVVQACLITWHHLTCSCPGLHCDGGSPAPYPSAHLTAPAGASALSTCELLLKLYPLKQPLLSRHTTEVLTALASSSASALPAPALAQLLSVVMEQEALWDVRDADNVLSLTRLLEAGLAQLHRLDPELCR